MKNLEKNISQELFIEDWLLRYQLSYIYGHNPHIIHKKVNIYYHDR